MLTTVRDSLFYLGTVRASAIEALARHENALRDRYVTPPTPEDPFPDLREGVPSELRLCAAGLAFGQLDLSGFDLRGADLADADLSRTRLVGACLEHAIVDRTFFGVRDAEVGEVNLEGTIGDPTEPMSCGCDPEEESGCEHCGECHDHCGQHHDGEDCARGEHRICSEAPNRRDRPAFNSICSCCNSCNRHCACMTCSSCGECWEQDDWSGCNGNSAGDSCDYCSSCCTCSDSDNEDDSRRSGGRVPFKNRPLTFHTAKTFKVNPAKRFIAVEIETPGCEDWAPVDEVLGAWSASLVSDGSIQSTGGEITTAPASGDLFPQQIEEICSALKTGGLFEDTGKKCGLHVHVDARDFRWHEIRRLCAVWAKVEGGMWKLVAPSRREARWCAPSVEFCKAVALGKANPQKAIAESYYKQNWENLKTQAKRNRRKALDGIKAHKYEEARYTALNVHSMLYRGTIECRMHHGSWDAKKIVAFARVFESVVSWAYTARDKAIENLPSDPWAALMQIAPKDLHEWCATRRKDLHDEEPATKVVNVVNVVVAPAPPPPPPPAPAPDVVLGPGYRRRPGAVSQTCHGACCIERIPAGEIQPQPAA